MNNKIEKMDKVNVTKQTPIEVLLKIDEDGMTTARNLYDFLELAKGQFSRWAKSNILDNAFAEKNIDYIGFDIDVEGNKTQDYKITAMFAKKLAMTSHSEKGEQARNYFVKVEDTLKKVKETGAYVEDITIENVILNPDFGIKLLTELKIKKEKIKTLEVTNKQQEQLIGELKPKADYTDTILQSKALVNINQIAKDYGMSARQMNKILAEKNIQYKQGNQWLLYKKYHDKGYTSSETVNIERKDGTPDVIMRTKWTQKGRLFIYDLLKSDGIIPLIERKTAV